METPKNLDGKRKKNADSIRDSVNKEVASLFYIEVEEDPYILWLESKMWTKEYSSADHYEVMRDVYRREGDREKKKEKMEDLMLILSKDPEDWKYKLSCSMWADLHEAWRATRKRRDWSYEPRIKKSKDEEWNKIHNTEDVDIANTSFEDLPSNWQYENLEAAKVAIWLVFDKLVTDWLDKQKFSFDEIEKFSSIVHEERLKRNQWVYDKEYGDPTLAKPYEELPEEEKAKDRNQIFQALDKILSVLKDRKVYNSFVKK